VGNNEDEIMSPEIHNF